jgi:hypothetical protein
MKKKELFYLLAAAGIFLAAGYLGFTQLVPQKKGPKTVVVETAGKFDDHMDQNALDGFKDPTKTVDFNSPVDLSGLGNNQPFGR